MDNFTLIIALNLMLFVCTIFTIIVTWGKKTSGFREWQIASVITLAGFFLITLQKEVNPILSVIIGNYLILAGSFFQAAAALRLLFNKIIIKYYYMGLGSLPFLLSYIFFTYVKYNTIVRIIILSLYIFACFIITGLYFLVKRDSFHYAFSKIAISFFIFFTLSSLFYLLRIILTLLEMKNISSIYQKNLVISYSFLAATVYLLAYTFTMFVISLNIENQKLSLEKNKLSYLFSFLNDTAQHLDINKLYFRINEILRKTFDIDSGGIYLINNDGQSSTMVYSLDNKILNEKDEILKTLKKGQGISWQAIEKNNIIEISIEDYPDEQLGEILKKAGAKYLMAVPIKSPKKTIGAILIIFSSKEKLEIMDNNFFSFLGEQLGIVLHNALLYQAVNEMAHTDTLTKLFNRRKILEILDQTESNFRTRNSPFCIAIGDLDLFKNVNDTYGHECGDKILVEASQLFMDSCRNSDFVGRWGGEEFIFVFHDSNIEKASVITERIRNKFEKRSSSCKKNDMKVTISIGLTNFRADDTLETAIIRADKALYKAKSEGRNCIRIL